MTRFFFTIEEHHPNDKNMMSAFQMDLRAPPTEANLVQLEKNMLGILNREGHGISAVHIFNFKVLA